MTSGHHLTEQAATQADADAIERWATNAAAHTVTPDSIGPPYPLPFELLMVWALEHAGDLSTSRGATNALQFEGAVAEVFGEDGLQGQASMFVYQTRAEWQRAGLEHPAVSEALLTEVEAFIGETGTIVDPGTIGAADPVQAAYQHPGLRPGSRERLPLGHGGRVRAAVRCCERRLSQAVVVQLDVRAPLIAPRGGNSKHRGEGAVRGQFAGTHTAAACSAAWPRARLRGYRLSTGHGADRCDRGHGAARAHAPARADASRWSMARAR